MGYFLLVGMLVVMVAAYPLAVLGISLAYLVVATSALVLRRSAGLELWEVLVLFSLTGYVVLNYGFANLTLRVGGVPWSSGTC